MEYILTDLKESFIRNFDDLVERLPNIIVAIINIIIGIMAANYLSQLFGKTISKI